MIPPKHPQPALPRNVNLWEPLLYTLTWSQDGSYALVITHDPYNVEWSGQCSTWNGECRCMLHPEEQ